MVKNISEYIFTFIISLGLIVIAFTIVSMLINNTTSDEQTIIIDCVDGHGNRNLVGEKCEKTIECNGFASFLWDSKECEGRK